MRMTLRVRAAPASRERGNGTDGAFSSCLQAQALIGEVAGSLWQDRDGSAGSRRRKALASLGIGKRSVNQADAGTSPAVAPAWDSRATPVLRWPRGRRLGGRRGLDAEQRRRREAARRMDRGCR